MILPNWPAFAGDRDIKLGLERISQLLSRLGNPHKSLPPTIHIAGTNGKGSTLAYLEAILKSADYKVHKYTSPHLININERIVLAGKEIADGFFISLLNECKAAAQKSPSIQVTFFEGITVAAFLAFSRIEADILLLETGMGGRLDATNVIESPLLTIITSISFDHNQYLGDSLKKIAFEKAGIIKKHIPTIISRQEEEVLQVLQEEAKKKQSAVYVFGKDWKAYARGEEMVFEMAGNKIILPQPRLEGAHQIENAGNAAAALMLLDNFKIEKRHIRNGLFKAHWRARLEQIKKGKLFRLLPDNYQLFVDGAHNEAGAKAAAGWISAKNIQAVRNHQEKAETYLICAMKEDKDSHNFLKYLAGYVSFAVIMNIEDEHIKSKDVQKLVKQALELGIKSCPAESFEEAFQYIIAIHQGDYNSNKRRALMKKIFNKKKSKAPARIIICGSLYLAGKFLQLNN